MRPHGDSYDIFILVLTVMSLAIMVLLTLPLAPAELETLWLYDDLICCVFIGGFLYNLAGSHPRSEYLVRRNGWIDLLGSVPSVGAFPAPSGSCVSSGWPGSRRSCGASARGS